MGSYNWINNKFVSKRIGDNLIVNVVNASQKYVTLFTRT